MSEFACFSAAVTSSASSSSSSETASSLAIVGVVERADDLLVGADLVADARELRHRRLRDRLVVPEAGHGGRGFELGEFDSAGVDVQVLRHLLERARAAR